MSNWDEEEEWDAQPAAAPALPVTSTSAGGGNWDDEDASSEEEAELKKPSAPMKPSKLKELARKEREEKERKREVERMRAREEELKEMSEVERKMRQQQIVEEADLDNARDLFMQGEKSEDAMMPPAEPTLENFEAKTDEDYKKLAGMVGDKCRKLNDNPRRTLRYITFVKDVMRALTKDLGPDDAKDLSSYMGIISNEKREEFKKSKGIKKKSSKKTHVRVDVSGDMRDDRFDDFVDDFM